MNEKLYVLLGKYLFRTTFVHINIYISMSCDGLLLFEGVSFLSTTI